jgi:hypothetical protein
VQGIFSGIPVGKKFKITVSGGGYFEEYPKYASASVFEEADGQKRRVLVGNGGQSGEKGNTTDANAIAHAGEGGKPDQTSIEGSVGFISGNGGTGQWGMCLNGKIIGGLGGSSIWGGQAWYSGASGNAGGGGGENFGQPNAAGGAAGVVIIEW